MMSGPHRPSSSLGLSSKARAIAAIPVVVLLAVNGAYVFSAVRLRAGEAVLRRTYQARAELQALVSDLAQAEAGVAAYIVTREVSFLEPLDRARQLLAARQNRLNDTLTDPSQSMDLRNELVAVSGARLTALERIRNEMKATGEVPPTSLRASRNDMQVFQTTVSRMIRRQDELLSDQRAGAGVLELLALVSAIAGALCGLGAGVIAAIALSSRAASRGARPANSTTRVVGTPPPAAAKKTMTGSVLIVDDDARIRELLHRWLAPYGLELRQAVDAKTALAAIAQQRPSVILCDVHMPGHDGLWLAERVRTLAPTTAIVLATGDSTVSPFESLRKGVVSYVLKPFRREQVVAAVEEGLRWSANGAGAV
jgi:CheY-like chemotaxis protein/CHASE3 domain sensor protein